MTAVLVTALVVLGLGRRARVQPLPVVERARAGPVTRWLAPLLEEADVAVEGAAVRWCGAIVAAIGLGFVGGGVVLAGFGAVIAVVGPPLALGARSGRRDQRVERELPGVLEAVARSLRSGASIPTALREATTTGTVAAGELGEVLRETERGVPLVDALGRWVERRPLPGVRLVVGTLTVAVTSGGTPARAVDGVAATLRERAEVDREVRALATQARTSAVVVTVAPVAFAVLGVLGDERTAAFLLRTPAGLACLAIGLALDGFGAWWMTRIARSVA